MQTRVVRTARLVVRLTRGDRRREITSSDKDTRLSEAADTVARAVAKALHDDSGWSPRR